MRSEIKINLQNGEYILAVADHMVKAAVGRSGVTLAQDKREGDGKTPAGTWALRKIYYRPDRVTLPPSPFETIPITPRLGWCDDPDHPQYNQAVDLPFQASHETLWRHDHAYDVIIPLGYNDAPPKPGLGSAIFFHILHEGRHYTEGCVAISRDDMLAILPLLALDTVMIIDEAAATDG